MRILVTGANGQLGHDVMSELKKRCHTAIGTDIRDMDITNNESVHEFFNKRKPECVIHCAAFTAVDLAEDKKDECNLINAVGTENIADACEKLDAALIYLSTDYVFSGDGDMPWKESDIRHPLNIYGMSKYKGELAAERLKKHYIVRISWVFGKNGNNFVKTMLRLAQTNNELKVVCDQIGSPTYTVDLAKLLVDMAEGTAYGTYHATNEGNYCSWYEFAGEIFKQCGKKIALTPVKSDEFPAKAKRPHNSRMSKEKLSENGFQHLPDWKDALSRFLTEIGEKQNG